MPTTTHPREIPFVQARLASVYAVLSAIVLGLFVVAMGLTRASLVAPTRLGHLAAGVAVLSACLWFRGAPRSRRALATADLVGSFAVVAIGASTVALKSGVHGEMSGVLAMTILVTLRGALVPTPPWWTAIVTVVASLPSPFGVWITIARDPTWDAERVSRPTFVAMAFAWTFAAVLAANVIAHVVYGLRQASRLGPYALEEKLGEGGMGVVYRARHALLRRPTAVKLMARVDAESARRFEREVRLTSRLTHPNIVAIYDYGRTDSGVFYYAMELVEGMTLEQLIDREGPQPPARVRRILAQIASGLAEAHAMGLVHRDVKPANVILGARPGLADFVKVLDFGLVKDLGVTSESTTDAIKGTPAYMAPETILEPASVDARADLYALGALGYFLLTGRTPFLGNNLVEICSQHLYAVPPPLPAGDDPELASLLLACLAKRPGDRPAGADVLAAALLRER